MESCYENLQSLFVLPVAICIGDKNCKKQAQNNMTTDKWSYNYIGAQIKRRTRLGRAYMY
jgi:hypothetical protein